MRRCSVQLASGRLTISCGFPKRSRSKKRWTSSRRYPSIELAAIFRLREEEAQHYLSFLGAGAYRHYVPPAIRLAMRGGFLTAYTPYQAEVSQGYLQAIYEWQTYVCLLTGMDIANASVYDGATALARASLWRLCEWAPENAWFRGRFTRIIVRCANVSMGSSSRSTSWLAADGTTIFPRFAPQWRARAYGAVALQSPNFFGNVDTPDAGAPMRTRQRDRSDRGRRRGAFDGGAGDPASWGAEIVAGEAQSFGVADAYGGPYAGFIAATQEHMRRIPGRLVGRPSTSPDVRPSC